VAGAILNACVEFSAFEVDVAEDERDQTARNLYALSQQSAASGEFQIAVLSDSHQFYQELCALVETLNARDDLRFAMHLGDMAQAGLRQEFRWTLTCLQRLNIPFLTAIGNHDLISNGPHVYRAMFGDYEYRFDFGGARFVVFNGNYVEVERPIDDLAWLRSATEPSAEIETLIVFGHQPPPARAYVGLMNSHHVTAQVTGHYHRFKAGHAGRVATYEAGFAGAQQWLRVSIRPGDVAVQQCTGSQCVDPPR
jgi:predicted phosphodiesterase